MTSRRSAWPRALSALVIVTAALASPGPPAEEGLPRIAGPPGGSGHPVLRIVPRPGSPIEGAVFTIEVRVSRLRDAGAVAFHLLYDPEMVEPLPSAFTEGGVMRRGGASTSFLAAPASTGERLMLGIARLGRGEGARGDGLLCRLAFRALRAGPAEFAFDRAAVTTPAAVSIPASFRPGHVLIRPSRPERKGGSRVE